MASIARYQPRPVVTANVVNLKSHYQNMRMKSMLRSALGLNENVGAMLGNPQQLARPALSTTRTNALAPVNGDPVPPSATSAVLSAGALPPPVASRESAAAHPKKPSAGGMQASSPMLPRVQQPGRRRSQVSGSVKA